MLFSFRWRLETASGYAIATPYIITDGAQMAAMQYLTEGMKFVLVSISCRVLECLLTRQQNSRRKRFGVILSGRSVDMIKDTCFA